MKNYRSNRQVNLEKIFSDSDESSSRLDDSILKQYGNTNQNEIEHSQFSQLILKDLNHFQNDHPQGSSMYPQQQQHGFGKPIQQQYTTTSKKPSTSHQKVFIGGSTDQSAIDDSLINMVNALSTKEPKVQAQTPMKQNFMHTVALMNSIQKQLKSYNDSTQATSINGDITPSAHTSSQVGGGYSQNSIQKQHFSKQINPDSGDQFKMAKNIEQQFNQNMQLSQQKALFTPQARASSQPHSFLTNNQTPGQKQVENNRNIPSIPPNYLANNNNYYNTQQKQQSMKVSPSQPNLYLQPQYSASHQINQSEQQSRNYFFQNGAQQQKPDHAYREEQRNLLRQTENRIVNFENPFKQQTKMEKEFIADQNFNRLANGQLPIFCISCEEYVKLTEIDTHADAECEMIQNKKKQQQNNRQNQQDDAESILKELNDKILSIEVQLRIRGQSSLLHYSNSLRASNFTNNIDIMQSIADIQGVRSRIANNPSNDPLNISLLILVDRMIHLGSEKATYLMKLNKLIAPSSVSSPKSQTQATGFFRNQLASPADNRRGSESASQRSNDHSKRGNQMVTLFQSEKDSEVSEWTGTQLSYSAGQYSSTKLGGPHNSDAPTIQNAEDLKKHFFQLVLNQKFKLPPNHPARNIQIQELYSEVQAYRIPQQNWLQFINKKLQL